MSRYIFYFVLLSLNSLFSFEPTILVFGPPGSGKGTFSQLLKEQYGYTHISAGDLIREEIDANTPLSPMLKDAIQKGENIDSHLMQSIMEKRVLECVKIPKPLIIDGFGRTQEDMRFLYALLDRLHRLPSTYVLFLNTNDSICKGRIASRSICSTCGHVFNSVYAKPKVDGVCNHCSGALKNRINDTPEVIEKRICKYRQSVEASYRAGLRVFPHIEFDTGRPLGECLRFYATLAEQTRAFQGSAREFAAFFTHEPK